MNRFPNAPAHNTSPSRRRAFLAALWLAIGSSAAAALHRLRLPRCRRNVAALLTDSRAER
jgi:hypothetical protein